LLGAALGSMPYGFSVWNEDLKLLLFNQHYVDMYGFDASELRAGMTLRDVCELTIGIGNHPGVSADDLFKTYSARFDETRAPGSVRTYPRRAQGRSIKATYFRSPGLGWTVIHQDVTEAAMLLERSEQREAALSEQNLRFDAAISHMSQGLSMYDADRRLVICNERYRIIYDMPPALCAPGTPFEEIIAFREASGAVSIGDDDASVNRVLDETSQHQTRVYAYRLKNGRVISVTQSPMANGGFVATHQDVTLEIERFEALQARETDLEQQNMRFDAAVNNMSQGLCMFDAQQKLVICNEPYARIYNLPPLLMKPGTTLREILAFRLSNGIVPAGGDEAYVQARLDLVAAGKEARENVELRDGRVIAIQHHPMNDGGWVSTHHDITEQQKNEARIRYLARHDPLTDLPNRMAFREELAKAEARTKRGEMLAVLCVDLDYFKAVNDTQGHAMGDALLSAVGGRLRHCSRETDIVGRLGGDEFAILAGSLEGPADIAAIADKVVRALAEPFQIDGQQVLIGASVGIAVAPTDGETEEILMKNADLALYRAKSEGRGRYHFFEKGMDAAMQHRRSIEAGLKVALLRNEFRLVFQPLLDLADNRVCCLEALLRWEHPQHGMISPVEFIPIAEETGVIVQIGEWVLREACKTAAQWPEEVRIAVNLSPVQFKFRGLIDVVVSALGEAGLSANRLELEITESLLLAETEATLKTLHGLRALGVRISMDDFGTGYSSLSYLRSFPFDKIKIDRSFMSEARLKDDSLAIIKAVIGLGKSLGMTTTAEGVETEDQLSAVRAEGCNEVQGFLFSPPLPASAVATMLETMGRDTKLKPRAGKRRA
jgi:diguanylate cyclase (GGDEF)-like protein